MWINAGAMHSYLVLTSTAINGPYVKVGQLSKLGIGTQGYGDETISVKNDAAWLVYTERIMVRGRVERDSVVQRLDSAWTNVTGKAFPTKLYDHATGRNIEAPAMFIHTRTERPQTLWYLVYSDPACAYCSGTGAAYATSTSPEGPWTYHGIFSSNSCGGQPAAVDFLDGVYIWQTDRWTGFPPDYNQYNARNYLAPLTINSTTGAIPHQSCIGTWTFP